MFLCNLLILYLRCLCAIGCNGRRSDNVAGGAHEAGMCPKKWLRSQRLRVDRARGWPWWEMLDTVYSHAKAKCEWNRSYSYIEPNFWFKAGESGEETDMSVCGEKIDDILPVEDLKGASRAMFVWANLSTARSSGSGSRAWATDEGLRLALVPLVACTFDRRLDAQQ